MAGSINRRIMVQARIIREKGLAPWLKWQSICVAVSTPVPPKKKRQK
jgi:hypothetical protein